MSICEDCWHYNEEKDYCNMIKDVRPRLLLGCDYFESIMEHLLKIEKIGDRKDVKARYHFSCDGTYRKLKMR